MLLLNKDIMPYPPSLCKSKIHDVHPLDDEALNPAAGSGRLDKEVEAIPVGVSSGRGGAEERGRKGLLGMAAFGLGVG